MQIEHFTYGVVTPILSYAISVLGSALGLVATRRARMSTETKVRARWLLLAAWAIGGTGIWVMHFIAMLGFSVGALPIRYDFAMTIASWLVAIVVVAIGLFIVGMGEPNVLRIIVAGAFTGVGVAGMHYTGMYAMHMPADVAYDRTLVIASIVIAVVAATVALAFTVYLRKGIALVFAALVMGVAVNGMHFTGMYAMRVSEIVSRPMTGFLPFYFLIPIVLFVMTVVAVLAVALINRPQSDSDSDTTAPPPPPPAPAAAEEPRRGNIGAAFTPRP